MSLDIGEPPIMAQLFPLFATNIVVEQIANHDKFKKIIVPKLTESFKLNSTEKEPWANNCHTCQKSGFKNDLEIIYKNLHLAIDGYFKFIGCGKFNYVIDAWYNIHTSDMYQENHNHIGQGVLLSGIYYIQYNPEIDQPVVFTANGSSSRFCDLLRYNGLKANFVGETTAEQPNFLNIKEGDLLLFPPTANHYVPRALVPHNNLRITLAFNVQFVSIKNN